MRKNKRAAIVMSLALLLSTAGGPALTPTVRAQVAPVAQGFTLDAGDLRFIYQQILVAQDHAAGGTLLGKGPHQVADPQLPRGLRTVDGTFNNLVADPDQHVFGAADRVFPRLLTPVYRDADPIDPDGPGPLGPVPTSYKQKKGSVSDGQPRIISNLIVDQSAANPAAAAAAANPCGSGGFVCSGSSDPDPDSGALFIPNITPDFGLSAPFNLMFAFFGQFFDHGLDLVTRGNDLVIMPLQPDDPLFKPGGQGNFMVIVRGANLPGPDRVLGDDPSTLQDESADDIREAVNTTTPWVDQNQTYTSHPSHQVFLRQYVLVDGRPVPDGEVLDGGDCSPRGTGIPGDLICNIGNWTEVKAQAAGKLGIRLVDRDVFDVPLLLTDPYGHFKPGAHGFPQLVLPGATGPTLLEGDPTANGGLGIDIPANAFRTGHAFLNDIAHNASPNVGLVADPDNDITDFRTGVQPTGTYDDELLGRHFVTGDGRGNENIALTMVHQLFHAEHNRLRNNVDRLVSGPAGDCRGSILAAGEPDGISRECLAWHELHAPSGWGYGERLFQAARFVTEMEYQHLVFEEFARTIQPLINPFLGGITSIDPAITAEFAHTVYRLGHSMLPERVGRINADGSSNDIRLLNAFLNPLEYHNGGPAGHLTAAQAAGSIIRGVTQQVGNELDEFVTSSVRNTLVGLPLDLAAINIARGRSEGIPPLNEARRQFYNATHDSALLPYPNWFEFGLALKHYDSLANFIAAYGTHPSITGATTVAAKRAAAATLFDSLDPFLFVPAASSGLNDVDFWVGGLAEKQAVFGGLLGTTFNFVFEMQLEKLQDGDRFYYLQRTDGLNLRAQLEGNSFAELARRNTDVTATMDVIFNTADLNLDAGTFTGTAPVDLGDNTSLLTLADGTKMFFDPLHRGKNIVFSGTTGSDRLKADVGDDSMFGNDGNDRLTGGEGNDTLLGGNGDDVLFGDNGDDVLKGGDGNDAMHSGPGFGADLLIAGGGHDFMFGGDDGEEYFAGAGNDFIVDGAMRSEAMFGGTGDDWIDDGDGHDGGMFGDGGNTFDLLAGLDPVGGNDVMGGGPGQDNHFGEGGDDIFVMSEGSNKFFGDYGFDWVTQRKWPAAATIELSLLADPLVNLNFNDLRNLYRFVDGASGWIRDDSIRGSDNVLCNPPGEVAECLIPGMELTTAGAANITGLTQLMGPAGFDENLNDPAVPGVKGVGFMGGDILLGGPGSDVIEGKRGDDLIDGDAWLDVHLEATMNDGTLKIVAGPRELVDDIFADPQRLNPGNIRIVRRIVTGDALSTDIDTAVFAFPSTEYAIVRNANGSITVTHVPPLAAGIPTSTGTDTLRNIERLQFADVTIPAPGAPTLVTVPPVIGSSEATATAAIAAAGLTSSITRVNSTSVLIGNVISQSPAGNQQAASGSNVALVVSLGALVPDVVGQTRTQAATAIVAAGLVFAETTENSTAPIGQVIRQTPAGATNAQPGSTVAVVVSSGPTPAPVVLNTFRGVSQGATSIVSPNIGAGSLAANTLLVAFVSADAPATGANTIVTSLTNTGTPLTWTNAVRSNAQRGTAEVWWTLLPAAHAAMTVSAEFPTSQASMLTVVALAGADGLIGSATAAVSAPSGAISASLKTTRANSLVFAAGTDWDRSRALVAGANQTIVTNFRPTVGDTYWVQRVNGAVGLPDTTVTISDTYGTAAMPDRWNLALVEIRARN